MMAILVHDTALAWLSALAFVAAFEFFALILRVPCSWRRTKGTGYSFWTEFNVVMVMHNLEAVAWLTALAFAAAFAFAALILRRCLHPRGLTLEEKMLNFDTRTYLLQCRPIGYFPHWYVRGPYA